MKKKTRIQEITPEWAEAVMERHYKRMEEMKFKQRPLSIATVRKYAAEIKSGAWKETPLPIIFDVNDDLIDGQHRLEAIRLAKKPVRMTISTGWPAQENGVGLVDVIDTGRPRTIAQLLHLHGAKSANNIAATVRTIATIALGGARPIMSYSNTLHMLNKLGVADWIEKIMAQSQSGRDFVARTVGPLCYYYSTKPNKAREFADSIFNFKVDSSPIQLFLRWAKNNVGKEQGAYLRAIAAAVRAFDNNDSIQVIKPSVEALDWLSNSNPIFQEQVRKLIPLAKTTLD